MTPRILIVLSAFCVAMIVAMVLGWIGYTIGHADGICAHRCWPLPGMAENMNTEGDQCVCDDQPFEVRSTP